MWKGQERGEWWLEEEEEREEEKGEEEERQRGRGIKDKEELRYKLIDNSI